MHRFLIILFLFSVLSYSSKAQSINSVAFNSGSYSQHKNIQYSASIGQFLVSTNFKNQKDLLTHSLSIKVDENKQNLIRFYPNPTHDLLLFTLKNAALKSRLQIFDLKGNLIIQQNIDNLFSGIINLEKLQPGIYFLRYITKEKSQTTKIMKK